MEAKVNAAEEREPESLGLSLIEIDGKALVFMAFHSIGVGVPLTSEEARAIADALQSGAVRADALQIRLDAGNRGELNG